MVDVMALYATFNAESLDLLWEMLFKLPVTGAGVWYLGLFQNNFEPSFATVWADIEECDFHGYSRVLIERHKWNLLALVANDAKGIYGTEPVYWTMTAGPPQTVYGFFILNASTGKLVVCQNTHVYSTLDVGAKIGVLVTLNLDAIAV